MRHLSTRRAAAIAAAIVAACLAATGTAFADDSSSSATPSGSTSAPSSAATDSTTTSTSSAVPEPTAAPSSQSAAPSSSAAATKSTGPGKSPQPKPTIDAASPVDIDQIEDVNDKIEALTAQLEAASDAAIQAEGQLQNAQAAAVAADQQAAAAKTALDNAVGAAKTMGHDLYVQGPLPLSTIVLVDSAGPRELIDRLSMLSYISAYQNGVLNDLIGAQDAYQSAKATAAQTASEMAAAEATAKSVKQQLETDLAANQTKLAALQAGVPTASSAAGTSPGAAGQPGPVVGAWAKPATGTVTTLFQMRWGTMHYGVDIANSTGTPIYAAGSGLIKRAGEATGFGLAVYILHDNGDVTVYGHVDQIFVSEGQQVSAGQNIAAMGSRGFSTGPHLHFEVQLGMYGTRVDPLPWLAARGISL